MTTNNRKYIKIVEGKMLPMRKLTIGVDADYYQFYRIFQMMGDYNNYQEAGKLGSDRIFSFYTQKEYDDLVEILDKLKVPHRDIGNDNDMRDNGEPKDTYTVSPVAKNPWATDYTK